MAFFVPFRRGMLWGTDGDEKKASLRGYFLNFFLRFALVMIVNRSCGGISKQKIRPSNPIHSSVLFRFLTKIERLHNTSVPRKIKKRKVKKIKK